MGRWRTIVSIATLAVVLAAGCSRADQSTSTGSTAGSAPSATVAPSATAPPTVGTAPTTATTSPTTTATTVRRPSTTTPTSAPTTAPATPPVLRLGGLGPWDLGTDQATMVAGLDAALGPSVASTDPCPSYQPRSWGGLQVIFYDGRFLAWVLSGPTTPPVQTERGIGYGATIDEVRAAYPEIPIGPSVVDNYERSYAAFAEEGGPAKMWAQFSGNDPSSTLVSMDMWGSEGAPMCGRS